MTKVIWLLVTSLFLSLLLFTNKPQTITNINDSLIIENDQSIVIGYSNWPGWWPWAIAEQENIFAKHDLDVEFRWYDDYSKSLRDLAEGYIDGNCQTLNDTISFAATAVKGEVVVLVNDNSAGNDKIIATENIHQVEDLKNKKIALEAGVVDDFLLTLALDKAGLSRNDVEIIDAETGAASEAFLAGQVDAVGAFPPFWLTALKRPGAKEIISSSAFPGAIADLLVTTTDLVDNHPNQVQKLVEVWFDILDFMEENPIKSNQIMAQRAGVENHEFQLFQAGTKMFSLSENHNAFDKRNEMSSLYFAAEKIKIFLTENFVEDNQKIDIDYNDIFAPQFIRQVEKPRPLVERRAGI